MSAVLLCQGTALQLPLKDASVHTVCTSPPYFALRRYDCGPGELGLEDAPEAYVAAMVQVFREVRRVLRPDGTLWLNMGDSYASSGQPGQQSPTSNLARHGDKGFNPKMAGQWFGRAPTPLGMPAKNLLGMPWRVALALQADGWILRSEIIWHKVNPMPESVQDRPTRSHEQVFLFSRQAQYYYDAEAGKEAVDLPYLLRKNPHGRTQNATPKNAIPGQGIKSNASFHAAITEVLPFRNMRTVWSLPSEPIGFQHYAAFPTALVRRCLLAGAPTKVCATCGSPWVRETQRTFRPMTDRSPTKLARASGQKGLDASRHDATLPRGYVDVTTTGFAATCTCNAGTAPSVVFDPFCGSATTLFVARELGHHAVGVDLSWNYLSTIARERLGLAALAAWQGHGAPPPAEDYTALPLFGGTP